MCPLPVLGSQGSTTDSLCNLQQRRFLTICGRNLSFTTRLATKNCVMLELITQKDKLVFYFSKHCEVYIAACYMFNFCNLQRKALVNTFWQSVGKVAFCNTILYNIKGASDLCRGFSLIGCSKWWRKQYVFDLVEFVEGFPVL